jgi:hypothetical protein
MKLKPSASSLYPLQKGILQAGELSKVETPSFDTLSLSPSPSSSLLIAKKLQFSD